MRRIALMVFRLFFKAIYYFSHIWWCSIHESISYEEGFRWCKKTTLAANKAGRVTIEAHGVENLPEKDGFIMFPNHQGLFDGLVFLESCPKVFSFETSAINASSFKSASTYSSIRSCHFATG